MPTQAQWKISCEQAEYHAQHGDFYQSYLSRYTAGWDFRNALEEENINCPAPMNDDILIMGNTNVFEVDILATDLSESDSTYVSMPWDGELHHDIYVFYDIDNDNEPWTSLFIGAISQRFMMHNGWVDMIDKDRFRYYKSKLWGWRKFIGRLKYDLKSPSI